MYFKIMLFIEILKASNSYLNENNECYYSKRTRESAPSSSINDTSDGYEYVLKKQKNNDCKDAQQSDNIACIPVSETQMGALDLTTCNTVSVSMECSTSEELNTYESNDEQCKHTLQQSRHHQDINIQNNIAEKFHNHSLINNSQGEVYEMLDIHSEKLFESINVVRSFTISHESSRKYHITNACINLFEISSLIKLLEVFLEYYCDIDFTGSCLVNDIDRYTYTEKLNDFIKQGTECLKSIYAHEADGGDIIKVLDNDFKDIIAEKDIYSRRFVAKYKMRLHRTIMGSALQPMQLYFYILKIIEKIPNNLDRLLMTSHLLYMIRSNKITENNIPEIKRFIIFLKVFYNSDLPVQLACKSATKIKAFINCFSKGRHFKKVLYNLTGINLDHIDNEDAWKLVYNNTQLIIYGLLIPFYVTYSKISSFSCIGSETSDTFKSHLMSLFYYSMLLHSYIVHNILSLRNGVLK